jgi:putative transcriptional regulator
MRWRSGAQAAGRVERARKRRVEDEEKVMTKKRDLFKELTEGFEALADQRAGKRTLRTHAVKAKPVPKLTARELARIREDLNLSRALFAGYLRTNVRTLENWEQGRAKPNAQAALLIRMVQRFPDTVRRLADI